MTFSLMQAIGNTCPIVTQFLNGTAVNAALSMCTMEGINGGSAVPGGLVLRCLAWYFCIDIHLPHVCTVTGP